MCSLPFIPSLYSPFFVSNTRVHLWWPMFIVFALCYNPIVKCVFARPLMLQTSWRIAYVLPVVFFQNRMRNHVAHAKTMWPPSEHYVIITFFMQGPCLFDHISSIRRHGYYKFQHGVGAAFVWGQCLFEGGFNFPIFPLIFIFQAKSAKVESWGLEVFFRPKLP